MTLFAEETSTTEGLRYVQPRSNKRNFVFLSIFHFHVRLVIIISVSLSTEINAALVLAKKHFNLSYCAELSNVLCYFDNSFVSRLISFSPF